MSQLIPRADAARKLLRRDIVVVAIAALLCLKVLVAIVWEYRWYFPADFRNAAFLVGREQHFHGLYRVAFYVHIIVGPIAILLAFFLMRSARSRGYGLAHRWAGRALLPIVVGLSVSGLVMAPYAFGGPVAAAGLSMLAIATLCTGWLSAWYAIRRRFVCHRRWSTRCFLLLFSPLLLRVMSGLVSVVAWESPWFYALNAWVSWVLPLAVHELWLNVRRTNVATESGLSASAANFFWGRSRNVI